MEFLYARMGTVIEMTFFLLPVRPSLLCGYSPHAPPLRHLSPSSLQHLQLPMSVAKAALVSLEQRLQVVHVLTVPLSDICVGGVLYARQLQYRRRHRMQLHLCIVCVCVECVWSVQWSWWRGVRAQPIQQQQMRIKNTYATSQSHSNSNHSWIIHNGQRSGVDATLRSYVVVGKHGAERSVLAPEDGENKPECLDNPHAEPLAKL